MRQLLTPKWIAAHVGVVVVAVLFVNLGFWQLRRLHERRLENAVAQSRYEAPPEDLSILLEGAGDDYESLRYRRAVVEGTYDTEYEVLARSQVYREQAGFHVVTPLVVAGGGAVLVNRGWVPLPLDTPPIVEAAPESGVVKITGWLSPSQIRQALGPTDSADGSLEVVNRIDIDRIDAQTPHDLDPVYINLEGEASNQLPVPVPSPVIDDEGPHLAYAIQWFSFALIGLVGYGALIRKSLSRPSRAN